MTILGPGQSTPAPWINVIANPGFGFQVSAEGGGYTWSVNSREHQLTPWSNDPVTDRPGEASICATRRPGICGARPRCRSATRAATYVARHGWGYSRFEHAAHGIAAELLQFVPLADPIKISRLTLRNTSGRAQALSVTAYVEWVLGPSRAAAAPFVTTEIDPETGAMFASNPWNAAFAIARRLCRSRRPPDELDRRPPRVHRPQRDAGLPGGARPAAHRCPDAVGAGLDPCGALRTTVVLPPSGVVEIVFFLGEAARRDRGAQPDRPLPRGRSRRRAVAMSGAFGTTSSARSR